MITRDWMSLAAALAVVATMPLAGAPHAQTQPELRANFTNAATAEVKDAQEAVVLRGEFVQIDEDDDDVERKAVLKPAGADTDGAGDAEVEYPKSAVTVQEVEFSLRNLTPSAPYTCFIDGQAVRTVTTNRDGRAEFDIEVKMPGATR